MLWSCKKRKSPAKQNLKKAFYLARLSPSWVFAWRAAVLRTYLFFYTCWHFSIAGFFTSKPGIYETEGKSRELPLMSFPGWSPWTVCLFCPPSESSMCLIYDIQSAEVHPMERIGKKMSTPSLRNQHLCTFVFKIIDWNNVIHISKRAKFLWRTWHCPNHGGEGQTGVQTYSHTSGILSENASLGNSTAWTSSNAFTPT